MVESGTDNPELRTEDSGDQETKAQLKKMEQNTLQSLENNAVGNKEIDRTPEWELISLNIQGKSYEFCYDKNMLNKDFIRINCKLSSSEKSTNFSSPINFSIPKELFIKNPISINADFRLSRALTKVESDIFDEAIIKIVSFYKEQFITTTPVEGNKEASNSSITNAQPTVEEFREERPAGTNIDLTREISKDITNTGQQQGVDSIESKYTEGQFNLPSEKWLMITNGITEKVTINDLILPGYNVIEIKNIQGETSKARWNGKSYISLGGSDKGLRPTIQNGDSFKNVSAANELIIKPIQPLQLLFDKEYIFLKATVGYKIMDLVADNQGTIEINYANTAKSTRGIRQGKWDSTRGIYVDTVTGNRILVYDGVQIRHVSNETRGTNDSENIEQNDLGNDKLKELRKEIGIINQLSFTDAKVKSPIQNLPTSMEGIGNSFSPDKWEDYTILGNVQRNSFCEALHNVESRWAKGGGLYGYGAHNEATGALGRYQFVPRWHPDLLRVSGVKSYQEFLRSPHAQETYMDHWINKDLAKGVKRLKRNELEKAKKYNNEELLALCHYLGVEGARYYVETGSMLSEQRKNNLDPRDYLAVFNNGFDQSLLANN